MWFKISSEFDSRFPRHYQFGNSRLINTDEGWSTVDTANANMLFKGYCHEHRDLYTLALELGRDPTPRYTGNFVAIITYPDGRVAITSDTTRPCPIWYNDAGEVGNIGLEGKNIWSDAWIELDKDLKQHFWPAVPGAAAGRTLEHTVDNIDRLLTEKFLSLRLRERIKVFYSAGIDTLTCIAYLRALKIPHELVTAEHYDYDQFTLEFDNELRSHWGYTQIHHWRERAMLVTGGCGDEYFMRGPATANMMLMHLGLQMQDVLQPHHYHYKYFQGIEKSAIYQRQLTDPEIQASIKTRSGVTDHIMRMCINDHQHWHLGNTLTFTPFKDMRILQMVLSTNDTDLVEAMMDATIQKQLIARHCPDLINYLATHKNQDRTGIYRLANDLY